MGFSNAETLSAKFDSDCTEPVYQKITLLFYGWTKPPIMRGQSDKAPNGVVANPGQGRHKRPLPRTPGHLRLHQANKI